MKLSSIIQITLALTLSLASYTSQAAFVGSRAGLAGTDFIDWGQFGPNSSNISDPANGTTNLGLGFTVDNPNGSLERRDQGLGWAGNFGAGDRLLFTQFTPGPISILFSSTVSSVGAQIQQDSFGAFTGTISVFDAINTLLETYSFGGNSTSNGDNSALFLGITRNVADIRRVEFNVGGLRDFAINQVDINGRGNVPEPTSLALLAIGMAGFSAARRNIRSA